MLITTTTQLANLFSTLKGIKFHAEFADGLCYNNPIHGAFDKFSPEVIISINEHDRNIYKHLIDNNIECEQRYAKHYIGNTFTNGSAVDIHFRISEDWELHHDASVLTGLKFALSN